MEIAKIVHGNDYETFESNICDMLAAHALQESNDRVTTFATIFFFSFIEMLQLLSLSSFD